MKGAPERVVNSELERDAQRKWWLLGAMSGVLGLIVLDETIVAVSLPSITSELGLSVSAAHWVVNAYLLSFTCAVAIAGRLGDHFGRKRYFSAGAAVFAAASLLAALATDGATLIAARAFQGIAAAVIFPTSIALITAAFAPEERGLAFGYQTTFGGIFMASGPLIGGLLTEMLSWRLIFWIGIPIVIGIALLLWLIWSPTYDPERPAATSQTRLERTGPALLIAGLFGLVTYVMQAPSCGWASPLSLGLVIPALAVLALFLRQELTHPAPLLDLALLKIPEFGGGVMVFAIFQLEKIAIFVFAAQYFQTVLGKSPILSGVVVSLAILPTLVTSVLVGKATDRFGSRLTLTRGAAVHGIAIVLFAAATYQQNYLLAFLPLILWGASMPSIAIPIRRVQMNAVPKDKHAQASGMNMTIQMLGGSLGLAACSAILAETQSYPLLFLLVGLVTLLVVPIGRRCIAGQQSTA
ncbi:MAG: MFS transporter [Paracoccaceae bacterium]